MCRHSLNFYCELTCSEFLVCTDLLWISSVYWPALNFQCVMTCSEFLVFMTCSEFLVCNDLLWISSVNDLLWISRMLTFPKFYNIFWHVFHILIFADTLRFHFMIILCNQHFPQESFLIPLWKLVLVLGMLLDAVEHILYFLSIAKPALTVTGLNSFLSICTNKESMCTNKESMCTNKEFICTNYESICTNKEYIFLAPKMGILP